MSRSRLADTVFHVLCRNGIVWPGGPDNIVIRRTRAGRHQLSAGSFSWTLAARDGRSHPSVGGYEPLARIKSRTATVVHNGHDYVVENT